MDRLKDIAIAIKELERSYGRYVVVKGTDKAAIVLKRLATGSLGLDIALYGGWLCGHVNILWSAEGGGKNFLACKAINNAQREGLSCALIPIESSLDAAWYQLCGVDTDALYVIPSIRTLEEGLEVTAKLVESGMGVVAVDSIVGLSNLAEQEKGLDDDGFSAIPRKIGEFMRRLQVALMPERTKEGLVPNECCVLLLNQMRVKVGGISYDPDIMPGGKGLAHLNHNLVRLRVVQDLKRVEKTWQRSKVGDLERKEKEISIGQVTSFEVRHAKFQPRGGKGTFSFMFAGERKGFIDTADEVMRYGLETGYIANKEGSRKYALELNEWNGKPEMEAWFRGLSREELDEHVMQIKRIAAMRDGWNWNPFIEKS